MQEAGIRSISFAGAGNVAGNLALAFFNAGFTVRNVISRNPVNAGLLASKVNAQPVNNIDQIGDDTDLLILALPDQAIPGFSMSVKNAGKYHGLLVHTSGSQSLNAITQYHAGGGVLYPLQSFTRFTMPDISRVPFCIEGASPEITGKLARLAGALSKDVRLVDTAQRARIHLAAVFACNFSNFMYATADCLLAKSGVDPNILLPLIQETAMRVRGGDAATLQTGPAARGDWSTIDMHLNMLKSNPEYRDLYKIISDLIVKLKESGSAC